MIPLHIRCTQRYKIDPDYPGDDAKWWRLSDDRAARPGEGRFYVSGRVPRHAARYANEAGYHAWRGIAGELKVSYKAIKQAVATYRIGTPRRPRRIDFMTEQEIAKDPYLCKTRQSVTMEDR